MSDLFPGGLQAESPQSRRERRHDRRSKNERRKNFISFVVMVAALALLIGGAWIFIKPMFSGMWTTEPEDFPGPGSGAVEVVVSEGDTGARIGATLVEAGVVKSVGAFNAAFDANPSAQTIQAGTYELPKEMKAVDAVAALLDSSYRVDVRITIPEGWSKAQIFDRVADLMKVPVSEVEAVGEEVGKTLPANADGNLEGWLSPGTYVVAPRDELDTVLTQMVDRMRTVLNDLDIAGDEQQDVLTKASIVEWEDPGPYRPQVARVIENRLNGCSNDKTLGMDSTVVYAFGKPYSAIPAAERDASPYNTRLNPGLPPTPIGSPSQESIEAVAKPADGNWCYFTTVNLETGETRFTDDPAEHQRNQEEYRRYLSKLRANNNEEEAGEDGGE